MAQPRRRHVQAGRAGLAQRVAHQRQVADLLRPEQPGAHAVVQVVAVVGDVVRRGGDLRLHAGLAGEVQFVAGIVFRDVGGWLGSGPLCLASPSSVSQVRFNPSNAA